ncbi:hypothetical protein N0V90_011330 [Kalmusia sp. IMI 367209]|nr:hypothetical protein N0V90_011330 [Kalmusia sp. IMI 367209]
MATESEVIGVLKALDDRKIKLAAARIVQKKADDFFVKAHDSVGPRARLEKYEEYYDDNAPRTLESLRFFNKLASAISKKADPPTMNAESRPNRKSFESIEGGETEHIGDTYNLEYTGGNLLRVWPMKNWKIYDQHWYLSFQAFNRRKLIEWEIRSLTEQVPFDKRRRSIANGIDRHSKRIMDSYASPICLASAKTVYSRNLPREIRDMVYSHLILALRLDPDKKIIVDCYDPMKEYRHDDYFNKQEDLQPNSWVMDPTFVGEKMAREIAQIYYKNQVFRFDSLPSLPYVLNDDPFNLELRPAAYIRNISVKCSHYRGAILHERLMPLLSIERKNVLRVEIHLEANYILSQSDTRRNRLNRIHMLNLLEALRLPVYNLIHAGSKVMVLQRNKRQGPPLESELERVLTPYVDSENISSPIVNFFQLSAREWDLEKFRVGIYDIEEFQLPVKETTPEVQVTNALKQRWGQEEALGGFRKRQG